MENIFMTTVGAEAAEEAAYGWIGDNLARIIPTTPAGVYFGQLTDRDAWGLLLKLQAFGVIDDAEFARWESELAH